MAGFFYRFWRSAASPKSNTSLNAMHIIMFKNIHIQEYDNLNPRQLVQKVISAKYHTLQYNTLTVFRQTLFVVFFNFEYNFSLSTGIYHQQIHPAKFEII